MRISYLSPGWLKQRRQRSRSGRSRSLLCLPVLAVALMAFALPQAAGAAVWNTTLVEYEKFGEAWGESHLEAVSCSPKCWAVGYFENYGGSFKKLLVETGGAERLASEVPLHEPVGTVGGAVLQGISCKENRCSAVGYYTNSLKAHVSFAEHKEELGEWKVQTTPEPAGSIGGELKGVSCFRPALCTAVGEWENSSHVQSTYAVQWKPEPGWKLQTTVNPSEVKAFRKIGVSCPTETACEMAGTYENSAKKVLPFAERWNGTTWSSQAVPTPAGSTATTASAVSCSASAACTIVGNYDTTEAEKTLAWRWGGTEWALQTPKSAEVAVKNLLTSVSCASATQCIAVGEMISVVPPLGQSEIWNGTEWQFLKTSESASRQAIQCRELNWCMAVGFKGSFPEERAYAASYH